MTARHGCITATIVLTLGAAACGDRGAEAERPAAATPAEGSSLDARIAGALPPGATADAAVRGRELFAVNCAACHGGDGDGTMLGPSLVADEWAHVERDVDQIAQIVRSGVAQPAEYPIPMPARDGELGEEELRALGVYVYALQGLRQ